MRISVGWCASTIAVTALGVFALPGCAGPRVAPSPPVKGDHRYQSFRVLEARLGALNDHDLEKLVRVYSAEALILDSRTNAIKSAGIAAIQAQHARLLAGCADITFEVVKRSYADRGRFVAERERARCGAAMLYERSFKYEIDLERFRIVRVWEEPQGGKG